MVSSKASGVVDVCRQQESSTQYSQRACPTKFCNQNEQGACAMSTQRACPAKYCKQCEHGADITSTQRACPAKYCESQEVKRSESLSSVEVVNSSGVQELGMMSTQRACPAKYCERDVTLDERATQNHTRDGVSDRIGGGGGTQPIFGGLPTNNTLDAEDLREIIDDDSGMKSIDDRELEKADGDDANVNGTGF